MKTLKLKDLSNEQKQNILNDFKNTLVQKQQLMRNHNLNFKDYKNITKWLENELGLDFLKERKRKIYGMSKLGSKNPMKGKKGKNHHNYKGRISDGKGYIIVLKPDWYTGRKGNRYVFEHSVVMCKHLGITEIPKGFVVHHIDENKTNNNIDNLCLVSISGHGKLHGKYK